MGPATLAHVLRGLHLPTSDQLIVGLDVSDDAAVYRLTDELALVQTVDFFPPIVDDAYTYGAIAAANSLSDVYAMGGTPMLALAVAGFPDTLPAHIITAILQGGADKVAEAGAVLAGGHTTVDQEPKYGLSVTGQAHPQRLMTKGGAQVGDLLVLTKPLGTGIITTAHKRSLAAPAHLDAAIASMLLLNRAASARALAAGVRSATDITGYGLLGHGNEMAQASGVQFVIRASQVPLLPGARDYTEQGILPGGLNRNRGYLLGQGFVNIAQDVPEALATLLFDPQTSGGLLLAVPPAQIGAVCAGLAADGVTAAVVGEVAAGAGMRVVA